MAKKKYFYPPAPPVGSETFSDDLVGLQLVKGGGLTTGGLNLHQTQKISQIEHLI